MDPLEWESQDVCVLCGETISPEGERGFAFGADNVLCWECATERGGRYDAERDAWETPPDLSDLPDEAFGGVHGRPVR